MVKPEKLNTDDKVTIVAPARFVNREELRYAMSVFESWGLEVLLHPSLFDKDNQFAGDDQIRAQVMQWAIDHTQIKAIFCARGGYGTVRIIDQLSFDQFLKQPKWIVGFSDITVLHAHINNLGVCTLHGSMPLLFERDESIALDSLRKLLFQGAFEYKVENSILNKGGRSKAKIVGGNLSVLYSLLGSQSFPDLENKILFIEDLDEYLYHIDRMCLAFDRAGIFKSIAGLVVGGMTDMNDNTIPFGKTAEEIILDRVKQYSYPVLFNFPAGHIPNNIALLLGDVISLEIAENSVRFTYV